MKIENVPIMQWGYRSEEELTYKKEETKLPEKTLLLQGYQDDKQLGHAYNFKKTSDGVTCDLEIQDTYFQRILGNGQDLDAGPKLEGKVEDEVFTDAEILNVSIIFNHVNPELRNNVSVSE